MTITPGDFRDAEGNIDRIAYEDARRAELDRIASERAAEAGERVAKSLEASDSYVRAEDHFRYGSSDPISYEDVRRNIAATYNPADAMWTIDADGNATATRPAAPPVESKGKRGKKKPSADGDDAGVAGGGLLGAGDDGIAGGCLEDAGHWQPQRYAHSSKTSQELCIKAP